MNATPHRRYNPLLSEWILCSPHRALRPWQGAQEQIPPTSRPEHDPSCYLCPRVARANKEINPNYTGTFVFTNDFSAVLPETSALEQSEHNGLFQRQDVGGICRVICFSPRHDKTLADLSAAEIKLVIDTWQREYASLKENPLIEHVMTFENKGAIMGCSNPHPHGQIWATSYIPALPAKSLHAQSMYYSSHTSSMLQDYAELELKKMERVISYNESFVAVVPYWAAWPYETMIIPRRQIQVISDCSESEKSAWSSLIKELTSRYDKLFATSFPYSMGVYQRPTKQDHLPGMSLYQIFMPPLLRSATVKKFMVGFELCAEPQRDITAEQAATTLRNLSL